MVLVVLVLGLRVVKEEVLQVAINGQIDSEAALDGILGPEGKGLWVDPEIVDAIGELDVPGPWDDTALGALFCRIIC